MPAKPKSGMPYTTDLKATLQLQRLLERERSVHQLISFDRAGYGDGAANRGMQEADED